MENAKQQRQEPKDEIDYFTRMMFGNSKYRAINKESENNSQESALDEKHYFPIDRANDIGDWFLGNRRKESLISTSPAQNSLETLLNNVDLGLLMETVDMFVATSKQLKPLFKEVSPFLHQLRIKFKLK